MTPRTDDAPLPLAACGYFGHGAALERGLTHKYSQKPSWVEEQNGILELM